MTNKSSGAQAVVAFKEGSTWGGASTRNKVEGKVFDANGSAQVELVGRWDEHVDRKEGKDSYQRLWRVNEFPPRAFSPVHAGTHVLLIVRADAEKYYGFSTFAAQLNETSAIEEGCIPPSDSRLRPDQLALEIGDVDSAEETKKRVEEKQRMKRKDVEHPPEPKFFVPEGDGWKFGGDYCALPSFSLSSSAREMRWELIKLAPCSRSEGQARVRRPRHLLSASRRPYCRRYLLGASRRPYCRRLILMRGDLFLASCRLHDTLAATLPLCGLEKRCGGARRKGCGIVAYNPRGPSINKLTYPTTSVLPSLRGREHDAGGREARELPRRSDSLLLRRGDSTPRSLELIEGVEATQEPVVVDEHYHVARAEAVHLGDVLPVSDARSLDVPVLGQELVKCWPFE